MSGPSRVITPASDAGVRPPATVHTAASADDWASSAASEYGFAIPRRFLWLADIVVQVSAVLVAYGLTPLVKQLGAPGGLLRVRWLRWLSLPDAATLSVFPLLSDVLWVPIVVVPATLLFMELLGGYRPLLEQSRTRLVMSSVAAPVLGLSLLTMLLIATRNQHTSRAFIFSLTLLTALGFFAYRWAIRAYKQRRLRAGYFTRNVVAVGSSAAIGWLSQHFAQHVPASLYRLSGYLTTSATPQQPATTSGSEKPRSHVPHLGQVDALGSLLVHLPVHQVIAVESAGSEAWLRGVIEQCDYFRVTLRLVPEELLFWRQRDLQVTFRTGPLHLPEIVLRPPHFDSDALFVKRVFDIIVSAALLVLLSPVFLVIAVAIKITTPQLPVFYPWRVIGYKGHPFTGYKFTTMQADADERKAELMHLNEMSGPVFKIRNDPRITPLGRFLRKFSLNELPQLWSVLKGDMSLVGPRPGGPHELARYELWHKRKLCVQPGITCLWQIRGRNKTNNFDDWVRLDFEYIDNWSLWLDLRILVRTVWVVLGGTGS